MRRGTRFEIMATMETSAAPIAVGAIDHLVINVRDVEATVAWYVRVLGMTRRDFQPGAGKPLRASLVFGNQKINVRPVGADTRDWFTGANAAAGSDDLCFLTDVEPEGVLAHLRACGILVELGPVAREGARGTLRSVYCRDPDGNLIEIASYAATSRT